VEKLDCAKERGKLLVDSGLALQGYEGQVWALGDCAYVRNVKGSIAPPTAQHAIREATTAAINIAAAVRGGSHGQFTFEGLGTLGSLGHGSAVAEVFGVKVSGLIAWILWRCIYLMKMPGFNRKVRISTDWALHILFPPDLAQTRVAVESDIRNQHFEPGETIFSQGDLGDNVYVIESGECEALREENGETKLIATLKAGEYFGEMAVVLDNTRSATIRAKTPLNTVLIPKADFEKLRKSVPAFGAVFQDLAKARSENLEEMWKKAAAPTGNNG
jgi:NADH dehydrogenase